MKHTAYEIADAWEDMDEAVKEYRRSHGYWRNADRVEAKFMALAEMMLDQLEPEPPESP